MKHRIITLAGLLLLALTATLTARSQNKDVLNQIATLYVQANEAGQRQDFEAAVNLMRQIVALDPADKKHAENLGGTLLLLAGKELTDNKLDMVLQHLNEGREYTTNPYGYEVEMLYWMAMGKDHASAKNWEQAEQDYERAYQAALHCAPADTAARRLDVDEAVSAFFMHRGMDAHERHDFEEAIEWYEKACDILSKDNKNTKLPHSLAASLCAMMATDLSTTNDAAKAIEFSKRAYNHYLAAGKNDQATEELARQALILDRNGEPDKAAAFLDEALKQPDISRPEHLYRAMGEVCHNKGDYARAVSFLQMAYNRYAQCSDSANVAIVASSLGNCYKQGVGDAEKASYWMQRYNEWLPHKAFENGVENPEDHPNLVNYIDFIKRYEEASDLCVNHEYEQCIELCNECILQAESKQDVPKSQIADFYALRALAAFQSERFDISNTDFPHAISLYEETQNKDLAQTCYYYAISFFPQDKPDEALGNIDKAIEMSQKRLGTLNEQAMKYYDTKVDMGTYWKRYPEAFEAKSRVLEGIGKTVKEKFPFLTSPERRALMEKWEGPARHAFTIAYLLHNDHSAYCNALYDWLLLSKGTMLAADSRLQRAINGDAHLKAEYDTVRTLIAQATNPNLEPAERTILRNQIDFKERQLAARAQDLHHFMDFLNVNTDDVRNVLRPGEAAVEFASFKVGADSTMYAALLLRHGDECAQLVPLFEASQYDPLKIDAANSALVWGPILGNLHNINKVYFSTTGMLDCSPIESMPLPGGQGYVADRIALYRLSSTRQLAAKPSPSTGGGHATVYGGLNYGATANDLKEDQKKYARNRDSEEEMADSRSADIARRLAPPELLDLQYSLAEAQEAQRAFTGRGTGTRLLDAKMGTEASFKALDGKGERFVHLSTHGFYCPEDKITATVLAARQATDAETDEDLALTRSGLYMSGALSAFDEAHPLPEGIDDGILTSLEVSTLDLDGLDMVVLSACKTAMGDMKGDGVFGLQRGFKKAGAGSILMSLWNVNDLVTAQLMKAFYSEWIGDKNHPARTKRDALEAAKAAIRENYPDPKYWAPFILLDALDH